jgi:hypothetical protein
MSIGHQEILTTLKNPHWQPDMNFQLMEAQAQIMRLERHNRTLSEILEYKHRCRKHGKKDMAAIMANCERLYRTGYDL